MNITLVNLNSSWLKYDGRSTEMSEFSFCYLAIDFIFKIAKSFANRNFSEVNHKEIKWKLKESELGYALCYGFDFFFVKEICIIFSWSERNNIFVFSIMFIKWNTQSWVYDSWFYSFSTKLFFKQLKIVSEKNEFFIYFDAQTKIG